jgi:hypothetical protein
MKLKKLIPNDEIEDTVCGKVDRKKTKLINQN